MLRLVLEFPLLPESFNGGFYLGGSLVHQAPRAGPGFEARFCLDVGKVYYLGTEQTRNCFLNVVLLAAALNVMLNPVQPVRLGTTVNVMCSVALEQMEFTRSVDFTWIVNGSLVSPSSSQFNVTSELAQSTLIISPIDEPEVGVVTCVASEPLHFPSNATTVLVETDELYLRGNVQSQTLYVPQNTPLVLECPLRSRSKSTSVKWFSGSRSLVDGEGGVTLMDFMNGSSVAMLGTATLLDDDGDMYRCDVANEGQESVLTYDITIFVTSECVCCQRRKGVGGGVWNLCACVRVCMCCQPRDLPGWYDKSFLFFPQFPAILPCSLPLSPLSMLACVFSWTASCLAGPCPMSPGSWAPGGCPTSTPPAFKT